LRNAASAGAVVKADSEIPRSALASTLEIRFNAQKVIAILPIITGLNTTNGAVHVNGVRAVYAERARGTANCASKGGRKIIHIGTGSPEADAHVQPPVEAGPAKDEP
jgi:hypothetical protein